MMTLIQWLNERKIKRRIYQSLQICLIWYLDELDNESEKGENDEDEKSDLEEKEEESKEKEEIIVTPKKKKKK